MSFDVNVLSSKPVIKAAANMQNDGGGGNLGYMSQGRGEEKERHEEINIFAKPQQNDTFTNSSRYDYSENESFDIIKFITNMILKIKYYLKI